MMGRLQGFLQGMPVAPEWRVRNRPWAVVWIGNRISDWRYWLWRASRPFTRLRCRLTSHRYELYDDEWRICERCDDYYQELDPSASPFASRKDW